MATSPPRWTMFAGIFAVACGAVAGSLSKPGTTARLGAALATAAHAAPDNHTATTGSTSTGSDSPEVTLSVADTPLPAAVVQQDVRYLRKLFQGHPGDGAVRGPDLPIYNLDVRTDPRTHQFVGHLDVHFHNNLGQTLDRVYLNVWPNATHFRKAGGCEQVTHVRQGVLAAPFSQSGSVLTVHLLSPVKPDCDGELSLDFTGTIPDLDDRFGYQGSTVNMGNWYPVLAVHDKYGWVTPPYYPDGESFYSLTGVYHLRVTVPTGTVVAASGEEQSHTDHPDGTTTICYEARGVRDVAWVADPNYRVMTTKAGNTTVYVYYQPDHPEQREQAATMAKAAQSALLDFGRRLSAYPYATLRVCAMQGWFGGMEYPQLVMISFPPSGKERSPQITQIDVAHEVAHQWFYGMVGDDEYLTPWLDESFATFFETDFDHRWSVQRAPLFSGHPSYSVRAFPSSDEGENADPYYLAVYAGGAKAIDMLRKKLGEVKFDRLMKTYLTQYQYRVATTADFIQAASAAAGHDLTKYFADKLSIHADDDVKSPTQGWVSEESEANDRAWAGED